MDDKWRALQKFWEQASELKAFDENAAYDETMDLPDRYITYEAAAGHLDTGSVPLTASLWYRTMNWQEVSSKADEISAYIGFGGKIIPVAGGYIWITKRNPFAQRATIEQDSVRRMFLNISVDFLTAN